MLNRNLLPLGSREGWSSVQNALKPFMHLQAVRPSRMALTLKSPAPGYGFPGLPGPLSQPTLSSFLCSSSKLHNSTLAYKYAPMQTPSPLPSWRPHPMPPDMQSSVLSHIYPSSLPPPSSGLNSNATTSV